MLDIFKKEKGCNKSNKRIKKLPINIETLIISEISKLGVFTGSRALGGYTEESDYDFILSKAAYLSLVEDSGLPKGLDNAKYSYRNSPTKCFYYKDSEGKLYNLIVFEDKKEENSWIKATQLYKELVVPNTFTKSTRVKIFEALCAESKLIKKENHG